MLYMVIYIYIDSYIIYIELGIVYIEILVFPDDSGVAVIGFLAIPTCESPLMPPTASGSYTDHCHFIY